jgi:hypothetical protein
MKTEVRKRKTEVGMRNRMAISTTAALMLAAGILSVPSGTFARGAGASHGPMFGFHPRIAVHRPFRPAFAHRVPARFGWRLRWWNHRFARNRNDTNAGYAGYGGSGASYPGDVTGTVPETGPGGYWPPVIPPAPAEHVGCLSHNYDVPGEGGGVAKVTVTRC